MECIQNGMHSKWNAFKKECIQNESHKHRHKQIDWTFNHIFLVITKQHFHCMVTTLKLYFSTPVSVNHHSLPPNKKHQEHFMTVYSQ